MKKIFIIIAILGAVGAGILLLNSRECQGDKCDIASNTTPTPTVQLSIVEQARQDLNIGGLLVDVRTPEEFAESHAKDAINIPLTDIEQGIYPSVAKDQPVYVYCRSGNRSNQAQDLLEQAGFTRVIDIGGLIDWQNQGGEVISS